MRPRIGLRRRGILDEDATSAEIAFAKRTLSDRIKTRADVLDFEGSIGLWSSGIQA
jgi:hypothetical protein